MGFLKRVDFWLIAAAIGGAYALGGMGMAVLSLLVVAVFCKKEGDIKEASESSASSAGLISHPIPNLDDSVLHMYTDGQVGPNVGPKRWGA